jgi:predicted nucleotidyltransferase
MADNGNAIIDQMRQTAEHINVLQTNIISTNKSITELTKQLKDETELAARLDLQLKERSEYAVQVNLTYNELITKSRMDTLALLSQIKDVITNTVIPSELINVKNSLHYILNEQKMCPQHYEGNAQCGRCHTCMEVVCPCRELNV